MSLIHVRDLTKTFGSATVVDRVNFSIEKGEIFAFLGHSGAGKSTVLRCLNGLEPYQGGSVRVNGMEVAALRGKALRTFRKNIGMVFQSFALMNRKSVFENVAMPLRLWAETANLSSRVGELLDLVGLSDKRDAYPRQLSGGQKQRVGVARALALNPQILLCDEPTSALDPSTTNAILHLLRGVNERLGITIVLVAHQMEVVKTIAHRAVLLDKGKVLCTGAVDELFFRPNAHMKIFLNEEEVLPTQGVNIRLFFPKHMATQCVITAMARAIDADVNIVWGKLERLNRDVLGCLVVNVAQPFYPSVTNYLDKTGVLWERA